MLLISLERPCQPEAGERRMHPDGCDAPGIRVSDREKAGYRAGLLRKHMPTPTSLLQQPHKFLTTLQKFTLPGLSQRLRM